jgi:hypothetical protein
MHSAPFFILGQISPQRVPLSDYFSQLFPYLIHIKPKTIRFRL